MKLWTGTREQKVDNYIKTVVMETTCRGRVETASRSPRPPFPSSWVNDGNTFLSPLELSVVLWWCSCQETVAEVAFSAPAWIPFFAFVPCLECSDQSHPAS